MEILENLDVVAAIGVMSTFLIQAIKKTFGKKYISLISKIVPTLIALTIAIMANYGFEETIMNAIGLSATIYAASAGLYKLK